MHGPRHDCLGLSTTVAGNVTPSLAIPFPPAVGAVKLATTGAPVIVMKSHHAYTYHAGMGVWVRVVDEAFPASQFHSQFSGARGGWLLTGGISPVTC